MSLVLAYVSCLNKFHSLVTCVQLQGYMVHPWLLFIQSWESGFWFYKYLFSHVLLYNIGLYLSINCVKRFGIYFFYKALSKQEMFGDQSLFCDQTFCHLNTLTDCVFGKIWASTNIWSLPGEEGLIISQAYASTCIFKIHSCIQILYFFFAQAKLLAR